jgi:rhodanese-related sulfurtransferase
MSRPHARHRTCPDGRSRERRYLFRMNAIDTLPNPAKARDFFSDKMEFTTGPVELKRALDAGDVVVVDVRAAEDYAKGHIPGAISLPKGKWENPTGLRHDKANVLYCYSQVCHLAATAAISLSEAGYPVKELEGGFEGWTGNKMPVEKEKR